MNDTKPTANAAITVVSAWAWAISIGPGRASGAEAREVLVQAPRVGGAQLRRVVASVAAGRRPAAAPARQHDGEAGDEREHDRDRHEVGREAEAVVLRAGEDAGPVAAHELGLDLLLRQPLR